MPKCVVEEPRQLANRHAVPHRDGELADERLVSPARSIGPSTASPPIGLGRSQTMTGKPCARAGAQAVRHRVDERVDARADVLEVDDQRRRGLPASRRSARASRCRASRRARAAARSPACGVSIMLSCTSRSEAVLRTEDGGQRDAVRGEQRVDDVRETARRPRRGWRRRRRAGREAAGREQAGGTEDDGHEWNYTGAIAAARSGRPHIISCVLPVEFLLFGLTLAGVALFHHRTLQSHSRVSPPLCSTRSACPVRDRPGRRRTWPPRPRVGDPRQPGGPAPRLRDPVEAFREEPRAAGAAAVPAGRLEGRLRAPGDRLRAVGVPRQHRRGDDRRGDGAHALRAGCTSGSSRRSSRRRMPAGPGAWSGTPRPR